MEIRAGQRQWNKGQGLDSRGHRFQKSIVPAKMTSFA
jgi:hypothetical protein